MNRLALVPFRTFLVLAELDRITPKKVAGTEESSLVCYSTICLYAFSPAFLSQFEEMTRIISLFSSLEGQNSSNDCISFFSAGLQKLSPQISLALCSKEAISCLSELKSGAFRMQLIVLLVYLLLFLRNLYWLRLGIAAQNFLPYSTSSASSANTSVKLLPLTLDTFVDLQSAFLVFLSAGVWLYSVLSNCLCFFQSGELRSDVFLENTQPLIS